jgi:RNA polymerase sigma-70 factor (ECF subfamily)
VDVEGHTQAEAARLEQLSVSGMKSRVQRGRERLGAMLNECCAVDTGPSGAVTSYARRDQSCC